MISLPSKVRSPQAVAETLQAKLTGSTKRLLASRPTENPEAHQLYLQGSFYNGRGTEADYRKAIDFYQRAIRLDPRYALAQSELSITWINLARKFLDGDEAQQAYAQARAAAEAALALEPNLAGRTWRAALSLNRRILTGKEQKPNIGARSNWRQTAALKHRSLRSWLPWDIPTRLSNWLREGLTNDPLCASCYHWLSTYLSPLGRLDEAEQAIRKAIELQPEHADFYTQLTVIAIQRGDAKAALSAAQKEIEAGGWRDVAFALAQQISGDAIAADAALKKLIDAQAQRRRLPDRASLCLA